MEERKHRQKKRKPKKILPVILAIVIVIAVVAVFAWIKLKPATGVIVATANSQPIYQSEIDDLYNRLPLQYQQLLTRQQLLNQTIARDLLLQAADKEGIVVTDKEVNELIDSLIAQSGSTRAQVQQQLASRNLTIADMVSEYKKQIAINRLLNKTVYSSVQVSDDEVTSFYNNNKESFEQVRASHILVNSSEEAQRLLDMIRKGADFSDIAKTYSFDKTSAEKGGDLDYFTRSQMVPEFSDAAFKLEVGQLSDVVQTQYGYHIIKVTAKRTVPFEDSKEQIRQALLQSKQSESAQLYIKQLWSQANIVFY
jgi:foldase protein PrsA